MDETWRRRWDVLRYVLAAALLGLVIWGIYTAVTGNDELDCEFENVERARQGYEREWCG